MRGIRKLLALSLLLRHLQLVQLNYVELEHERHLARFINIEPNLCYRREFVCDHLRFS